MPSNMKMKNQSECSKYEPQHGKFLAAMEKFYADSKAPSIHDMIMSVDADMKHLYRLLANDDSKKAIETARKNVNKWSRGKVKPSKRSQQKFKDLQLKGDVNLPYEKGLHINARGCFKISEQYVKANANAHVPASAVREYLQESLSSDQSAMKIFNAYYNLNATWLSNVEITVRYE